MIHYMLLQFGQLNNAELLTNVVRASHCATIIMLGYLTVFRKCIRTASGRFFQYVMKFMFQKRLTTNCAVFKSSRGRGYQPICVCGGGEGMGELGCHPSLQILTLFQTPKSTFLYPISGQSLDINTLSNKMKSTQP